MSIAIDELDRVDLEEAVDPEGAAIPPTRPGDILHHDFMEGQRRAAPPVSS